MTSPLSTSKSGASGTRLSFSQLPLPTYLKPLAAIFERLRAAYGQLSDTLYNIKARKVEVPKCVHLYLAQGVIAQQQFHKINEGVLEGHDSNSGRKRVS